MLRRRILSATVLTPILLAAIWLGDPWYFLLVVAAALLGVFEFYALASRAGWQPLTLFGAAWTLLLMLNAYLDSPFPTPLIVSAAAPPLIWLLFRPDKVKALVSWVWTIAGALYMGWLLSYAILLMKSYGREWVLLALFSTFAVDSSAFFIGRALGRRPLAPRVSPGKTWEGAIGGLIGGVAAAIVLARVLGLPISYGEASLIGGLISGFAQLGDLLESMFKRRVGAKDASKLIPGHGGILDRLDSIVFAIVVVYYYLLWAIG